MIDDGESADNNATIFGRFRQQDNQTNLLLPVRLRERPQLVDREEQLLGVQGVLHPEHVGAVVGVQGEQEVAVHRGLGEGRLVLLQAQGDEEVSHVLLGPEPDIRGERVLARLVELLLLLRLLLEGPLSETDLGNKSWG